MARKKETEPTDITAEKPKTRSTKKKPEPEAEPVKAVRSPRKPKAEPVAETSKVEVAPSAPVKKGLFGRAPVRAEKPVQVAVEEPKPEPEKEAPVPKREPKGETKKEPRGRPDTLSAVESLSATFRPRGESAPAPEVRPDEKQAPRERKPRGAKPPRAASEPFHPSQTDEVGRFVVDSWRVREAGPRPQPETAAPEPQPVVRAEKGRRGRAKAEPDAPAAWVEVAAPARNKPKPELPAFEPIAIPETAAQVVMIQGQPVLVKNHRVYPPLCFYGHCSNDATLATVMEEAKMAAEEGVHLFSTNLDLVVDRNKVKEAVAEAERRLAKFAEADREAQLILRVSLRSPKDWESRYKTAKYISEDGGVAEPSVCDDPYWDEAKACLAEFSETLSKSGLAEHVMGVHVDRNEWFFSEGSGYDTSVAAHEKFRGWLRQRYRDDVVTLRASWFDGGVQFETVAIPEFGRTPDQGEQFVRMGRKSRRWVDYHLFLSDTTVERLFELLYTVKKASSGNFLTGVSYGYTFEWSHPASGHLSLGKLLRCPFLDYLGGPPSYKDREPGGTAAFPGPVDSVALNGKLFLSEEDFKTPIGGRPDTDDSNPVMKTPQALESAHWRGAGAALSHKGGLCWMDSFGNGWLGSRGIWERGKTIHEAFMRRLEVRATPPDVAMFIDERSLALLVDEHAFGVLVQNVRESLLRSGLSVGFYLLSDLAHRENFPESKLYVFANAWDLRPEVRSAIKSRLQKGGKTLFWLYTTGLFEGGRESLERVREVTGIALRPQPFNSKPGTTVINQREPLCAPLPEKLLAAGGRLEPSYFAIPEDGAVLAEYTQTGLPSYLLRRFEGEGGGWTSVFLGEPVVTPGLFRALGEYSGCHVWSHHDDVVHASGPFMTIHCAGAGQRVLNLPDKWVAYRLETSEYAPTEKNAFRFLALDGSTWSFAVGPSATVDAMVKADLAKLAHIDTAAAREEDTVHWENVQFDVPIMKLDEWVEETWSDELADDLLIKPSLLEVDFEPTPEEAETEEPRSRGRRRNKRGRSRGGSRDKADFGDRQQIGETGMSVLFRKRE